MTVELFDPATMNDRNWLAGSEGVRAFVEAICGHGSERFVSNVRTRMMVLRDGDVVLPVTINDTEYENSYVCSTLTYTRYMRDELAAIDNPFMRRVIASALDGAGAIVRLARLNKVVQVNNWLVSTNPYPLNWSPNLVSLTDALVAAFPGHAICFRSLNEWANRAMIKELAATGYKLAAYRQIYVFDRLSETYWVHGNVKKDHRLLHRTTYRVVGNDELEEEDFPRMTKLYEMLYLQKHSILNPAFTPDFMRLCHARGIVRFYGLRHPSGRLDGMFGVLAVAQTTPLPSILGYDTSLDDRIGLYRMIVALAFETAIAEGWNINLSSGAAGFKRNRGGQTIMEYNATYHRHLSRGRRFALSTLAGMANVVGAPLMKRFEV